MAGLVEWLKGSFATKAPLRPASSTGGTLVYAVGDVHGQADLLDVMIEGLVADAQALVSDRPEIGRPVIGRPVIVLLGDYVDRGPDPAAVIDSLIALSQEPAFDVRCLKGNHEAALLNFLEDADAGRQWVSWGGGETLAGYGVQAPSNTAPPEAWEETRLAFVRALPMAHLAFLKALMLHTQVGDYLFVHAGVRPGLPLEMQHEDDLLWIRQEFLEHRSPSPMTVVHGHTPTEEPFVQAHRIGVDTGAYATGVLSAVRLLGEERVLCRADRA